ncbi:flagellar hook-basal body protein [Peribacillus saganii]|uniref:Flagellar hook-basal body protein n=1 Tax=Peribacillus saganii TaxID=2303992 RepID=A0A372LKG8_9BACI|nr:flagellar hook-basal body protein [Peribacillus saganii]RFU67092.1 flagellar hook-basal body protein [Peribacillus saganii]
MLRGFYTAASGMLSQQRRTEMLTNNMANANTPGFKADQSSMRAFPEMLIRKLGQTDIPVENGYKLPGSSLVGALNTGVYMQEAMPKFLQGDMQQTERSTDIALLNGNMPVNPETGISGTVLFSVANGNGEPRYTRNGNFTLDGQGFLTTPAGHYVLDDQNTRIQLNSEDFTVNEDGTILENNRVVARIGIGYTDNPYRLTKEGDGLFRTEDGAALANAYTAGNAGFTLKQENIEASNVDTSRTMTDMMTAYRAFEANQKVLQAYDRSMEKAVNEIGRLG